MPDGNESQIRTVADSLFDAWQSRAAAEQKRQRLIYGSIPAWVACALSVTAVLWQAAVTTQRVNDNDRRIIQLEVDLREYGRENKAMTQQLARIEAKMDLVLGERNGR